MCERERERERRGGGVHVSAGRYPEARDVILQPQKASWPLAASCEASLIRGAVIRDVSTANSTPSAGAWGMWQSFHGP